MFLACQQNNSTNKVKPDNNTALTLEQPSELAQLMRDMDAYTRSLKSEIKNHKETLSTKKFEKLTIANPTKSIEIIHTDAFFVYANDYQKILNELQNTDDSLRINKYNSMINTCLACHQVYCKGPISRIKKLRIKP